MKKKKPNKKQRGSLALMLIPVVAFLLLAAMAIVFWMATHKETPQKKAETSVSADDPLTNSNSNADLSTDVRILSAGLDRDSSYVSSTKTALDDEPEPVLND
jgi:flagellar basal body-associated protein FliL